MDIPTTPFVTECMVILERVRLRAILLRECELPQEPERRHDMMFETLALALFEGVAFKSAEAFFQAFEASLRDMPLTLKYFNRLRHYKRDIPIVADTDADSKRLIEAINREERADSHSGPPDFDLVRFPQRSAAFIHDTMEVPSSSCNS